MASEPETFAAARESLRHMMTATVDGYQMLCWFRNHGSTLLAHLDAEPARIAGVVAAERERCRAALRLVLAHTARSNDYTHDVALANALLDSCARVARYALNLTPAPSPTPAPRVCGLKTREGCEFSERAEDDERPVCADCPGHDRPATPANELILLNALDDIAFDYDRADYGLPLHDDASRDAMLTAVRAYGDARAASVVPIAVRWVIEYAAERGFLSGKHEQKVRAWFQTVTVATEEKENG